MDAEPDLGRIARTIGDPTRIRMLTLLMEGRALTAKELAYGSGVEPATGTAHLRRLLGDALVVSKNQGRHKYFRLASPQVARCVESLMVVALPVEAKTAQTIPPLHQARFCYDHLAGRIAIEMIHTMLERNLLRLEEKDFALTPKGARWFTSLGIDLASAAATRRKFAPACLDWSERQDHLGGALGAALAQHLVTSGWLKRKPGTRTALITERGRAALHSHWGICCA